MGIDLVIKSRITFKEIGKLIYYPEGESFSIGIIWEHNKNTKNCIYSAITGPPNVNIAKYSVIPRFTYKIDIVESQNNVLIYRPDKLYLGTGIEIMAYHIIYIINYYKFNLWESI